MRAAAETLDALGIAHEVRIVSAHRTPAAAWSTMRRPPSSAGLKAIIAGAGGAAHLPGMVAALTRLPVFGVPIESKALSGMDSLLSIVQMPAGVPVGTLAIGHAGAVNAALIVAAQPRDDRRRARRPARRVARGADGAGRGDARIDRHRAMIPPGSDDRHPRRRPARADAGAGGGEHGLPRPCLRARGASCRPATSPRTSPAPPMTTPPPSTPSRRRSTSSPTSSRMSPSPPVERLAARVPVRPGARALDVAQDRLAEKTFIAGLGGTPAAVPRRSTARADWSPRSAEIGTPAILKTRRMGYDGKGQARIADARRRRRGMGGDRRRAGDRRGARLLRPANSRSSSPAAATARRSSTTCRDNHPRRRHPRPQPRARAGGDRRARRGGDRPRPPGRRRARLCRRADARVLRHAPTARCSTRWRRASTTAATGRSRARASASSRTISAPSAACRSARRR